MRRVFWKYAAVSALVVLSGYVLMSLSQKVQQVEREIAQFDRAQRAEEEAVRVLKAEWAYLNDPARLEYFVSRYGGFSAPSVSGLVSELPAHAGGALAPDYISSPFLSSSSGVQPSVVRLPSQPVQAVSSPSFVYSSSASGGAP